MRNSIKKIFAILLTASASLCQAQSLDSLELALKTARHDTTRLKILNLLAEICELEDINTYTLPSLTIAERNLKNIDRNNPLFGIYNQYRASALNSIGFLESQKGEIAKALDYYTSVMST
ncbi:MAG: hypothetical protein H0W61_08695 [Bacteroidetes bacterium]|nr:hypothetical protein [Bacteroidota bacterium]